MNRLKHLTTLTAGVVMLCVSMAFSMHAGRFPKGTVKSIVENSRTDTILESKINNLAFHTRCLKIDLSYHKYEEYGIPHPLLDYEEDLNNSDYAAIERRCDEVLKSFPDDYDAGLMKCKLNLQLNHIDEAMEWAMKIFPTHAYTLTKSHPYDYISSNYPEKFYDALEKLITPLRGSKDAADIRLVTVGDMWAGVCLKEMGRNAEAIKKHYLPGLEAAYPDQSEVIGDFVRLLGLSFRRIEEPEMILECADILRDLDSFQEAVDFSNIAYRQLGKIDRANELILKAGSDEMDDVEKADLLAMNYTSQKRFDDAIKVCNELIGDYEDIDPDESGDLMILLLRRGLAYKYKGEKEKAEKDLQYVVAYAPDLMYVAMGHLGRAEDLNELLNLEDPRFPGFNATIYACLGQKEKAISWLSKAFEKQLYTPADIVNDVNLNILVSHPDYAETLKYYNPEK